MTYRTFDILVSIDGTVKSFEFPSLTIETAMADIRQAYAGDVRLVQYKVL